MTMFYTAPDKTASKRFEPNGIYLGEVKRIDAYNMAWVEIPRLVEGFDFGPVSVLSSPMPRVGDKVGCVFLENRVDDLIVVGVVQDASGLLLPHTQCTSTTRPTNPREGELIWEANTDLLRVWTGTTWHTVAVNVTADNSTVEVVSGVLRVKDAGITAAKLAPAVAGDGLSHNVATGLAVNVDNLTVEINSDAVRLKDFGVTRRKMMYGDNDNLVSDPQFEMGDVLTPHAFIASGGSWTHSGTVTRAGATSLRYVATSQTSQAFALLNGSNALREPHIPASQGDKFQFQVWMRVSDALHNNVYIYLQFRNSGGGIADSNSVTVTDVTSVKSEWNLITVTGTAPANCTYVVPIISVLSNGKGGTFYFDSVMMRRVVGTSIIDDGAITRPKMVLGDGDNLILDPLLEYASTATTPHVLTSGGGTWDFFAATKRSGTHSLRHQSTGQTTTATLVANGSAATRLAHVPASQGDRFMFEAWAQPVLNHNNIQISLEFRNSTGTVVGTSNGTLLFDGSTATPSGATVSVKNDWNRMWVVGQAPADSTWVVPVVTIASNSKTGTVYFDSLSMRRTVTAAALDPAVERSGFRNAIMNGDFSVNQRAFTSTTADGYGFDRWFALRSGATMTYSSQPFTVNQPVEVGYESANFARCVISGATGVNHFAILRTAIEDVRSFSGAQVTVSFWARAGSGTPRVVFEVERSYGTGGSPSGVDYFYGGEVVLSTSWQRHSLTFTMPNLAGKTIGTNANTSVHTLNFWLSGGSGFNLRTNSLGFQNNTFDFWGVQFERGQVATPFEQRSQAVELDLCRRYYQRVTAAGASGAIARLLPLGFQTSTTSAAFPVIFSPVMRVAPVVASANAEVSDDATYSAAVSTISMNHANGTTGSVAVTHAANGAQFRPCVLRAANNTTAWLELSADF